MAGRIPELETTIQVNIINADRLNQSINLAESIEGFNDLTNYLQELQGDLSKIRTQVAQMAGDKLIEAERNNIQHHYKTGKMSGSIDKFPNGEGSVIVGTTAHSETGFPYPLTIEFGRKEVRPVNRKFLHWIDSAGNDVFSKRSRAVKADPYVDKSIEQAWGPIESEIENMLGGLE